MKSTHILTLAIAMAAVATPTWAAQPDQHAGHHPSGEASAPKAKGMSGKSGADMARMDTQMKAMSGMHDKMMLAKTPEERSALMAEHMKTMQDGMSMMKEMPPGGKGGMKGEMGANHQMMEKRMDMMQSMMQLMMDRMPAAPGR